MELHAAGGQKTLSAQGLGRAGCRVKPGMDGVWQQRKAHPSLSSQPPEILSSQPPATRAQAAVCWPPPEMSPGAFVRLGRKPWRGCGLTHAANILPDAARAHVRGRRRTRRVKGRGHAGIRPGKQCFPVRASGSLRENARQQRGPAAAMPPLSNCEAKSGSSPSPRRAQKLCVELGLRHCTEIKPPSAQA